MAHTVGGYELIGRLGIGGSGTVWKARDGAGNICALKLLHPAIAATESSRARLIREARLVNQIPGEGIARVLDFEADAAEPFVVTELIEGPTLEDIIRQEPLSLDEALFLGQQLRTILSRIHASGIVHRDLKPSNVILSDEGPVLIDFGIAQGDGNERLTETGVVNGTPGYVSPELLSSSTTPSFELWRLGDWWAWSALLLSAMTGEAPFGTGTTQGVLDRVFRGEPLVGSIPDEVATVMRQALHPDPSARLSPGTVLDHLEATRAHNPPASLRRMPQIGILALGFLALLPALFQWPGLAAALVFIVVLATVSEAQAWKHKHPLLRTVAIPINILSAAARLLPGLALACAAGYGVWALWDPFLDRKTTWLASFIGLLVVYMMPFSSPLRDSPSYLFRALLRTRLRIWSTFVLGSFILAGIVVFLI